MHHHEKITFKMEYITTYLYFDENKMVGYEDYMMQKREGNYWIDVPE